MRLGAVIVVAKEPVPGRVKTRLTPALSLAGAASVAAAALTDTLRAMGRVDADERILAFDGAVDPWLPEGWRAARQPTGGLDVRLAAAFDQAGPGPAVLVGMDTPQLLPEQVAAFDPVRFDACLGRAPDGGYWAIGFARPRDAAVVIPGVPMSTRRTAAIQLQRMAEAGLRVQHLDVLTDVDTIDTAREVGRAAPATHFAAALAATAGAA